MEVDGLTGALGPLASSEKSENCTITGNISMSSGTFSTLREEGVNDLLEERSDVSALDDSISMEENSIDTSELLSSEVCNRAQFWGAVGIFIEKSHILNRRLCGVADLWWGKWSLPQTDSKELEASNHQTKETKSVDDQTMKHALKSHSKDTLGEREKGHKCFAGKTSEKVSNASIDLNTVVNVDNLTLMAWKLMQGNSEDVCNEKDLQETDPLNTVLDDCKTNNRTSQAEENMLDNLKTLLRNSAFEDIPIIEGRRFEPWPELTGGSKAVYAVVRRALPKQTLRFNTPLELVLLDGPRGRCSVVSSLSRPPLLPSRPYHLQHRLEDGKLAIVWHGGDDSNKQPIGSSVELPADDITTLPDSKVSPDNDTVSPANNTVSLANNTVSLANNTVSPANNTVSPANNTVSPADNTVSPANGTVSPVISSGIQWLTDVVLPRVARWATQVSENGATGGNGSLTNVDLQAYSALYSSLKRKYAEKLVKSWTERTDPHKFVHEDIGIATYVLLLWAKLPHPQRFLDLGCGNGLLVFILASEGHLGQGLDIKKRAIWDTFPPFVNLKEHVVRPHDGCLPSDADWLLGNHSDELTPWIPVMAARASYKCSFFVLPCCPHDFTAKFLRRNSSMSQYADYLDYVQEVGEQCGFVMERDRLKIPSTKRVCFVGRTRNHTIEEQPAVLLRLQQFIDKRVAHYINNQPARKEENLVVIKGHQQNEDGGGHDNCTSDQTNGVADLGAGQQSLPGSALISNATDDSLRGVFFNQNGNPSSSVPQLIINGNNGDGVPEKFLTLDTSAGFGGGKLWSSGFVARDREQRPRNCTQLRQDVKDELVGAVVRVVLGSEPHQACSPWQAGSSTPIRQVAEALGPRRLQQLKKECGGLQTLLRNHRHIFAVQRGTVALRPPGKVPEDPKRHRPCWFFLHHPQGCPNTTSSCIYDHTPLGAAAGPAAAMVEAKALA